MWHYDLCGLWQEQEYFKASDMPMTAHNPKLIGLARRCRFFWGLVLITVLLSWISTTIIKIEYEKDDPDRVVFASTLTNTYLRDVYKDNVGLWFGVADGVFYLDSISPVIGGESRLVTKWQPFKSGLGALPSVCLNHNLWSVRIPNWTVFLPFMVIVVYRFSRMTPVMAQCCKACGYNLTANISGKCPECGTFTTTGAS